MVSDLPGDDPDESHSPSRQQSAPVWPYGRKPEQQAGLSGRHIHESRLRYPTLWRERCESGTGSQEPKKAHEWHFVFGGPDPPVHGEEDPIVSHPYCLTLFSRSFPLVTDLVWEPLKGHRTPLDPVYLIHLALWSCLLGLPPEFHPLCHWDSELFQTLGKPGL